MHYSRYVCNSPGGSHKHKNMTTYKLTKTPIGKKGIEFLYQVIDQDGKEISRRTSMRNYVACTISGSHYFGRRDLVGKGEHGDMIKMAQGWGRRRDARGRYNWVKVNEPNQDMIDRANQVAYLDETK